MTPPRPNPDDNSMGHSVIARAPMDDLRALQRVLQREGIPSKLMRPEGETGGG